MKQLKRTGYECNLYLLYLSILCNTIVHAVNLFNCHFINDKLDKIDVVVVKNAKYKIYITLVVWLNTNVYYVFIISY